MSPGRRIIPARAGFTPAPSPPTTACADHPRSRGVYGARAAARTRLDGSSPLARGLPWTARQRAVLAGIIPARAGFTQDGEVIIDRLTDHPRSRGVYIGGLGEAGDDSGSSPLARGLPRSRRGRRTRRRIIPARAGFTC